jgi:hypothetical protein
MAKPYVNLPQLIFKLQTIYGAKGSIEGNTLGRLIATLQNLQQQSPVPATPTMPSPIPGTSNTTLPGGGKGGGGGIGGDSKFTDFFFPVTDTAGVISGIGGRIANAIYKTKAARQLARGNAAQHFASALSTPQSQAMFGNPLGEMAKISADAGQSNASKSLATGEVIQGSLDDISNFISSINTMRRLMKGDALNAAGLYAMHRLAGNMGRGVR